MAIQRGNVASVMGILDWTQIDQEFTEQQREKLAAEEEVGQQQKKQQHKQGSTELTLTDEKMSEEMEQSSQTQQTQSGSELFSCIDTNTSITMYNIDMAPPLFLTSSMEPWRQQLHSVQWSKVFRCPCSLYKLWPTRNRNQQRKSSHLPPGRRAVLCLTLRARKRQICPSTRVPSLTSHTQSMKTDIN